MTRVALAMLALLPGLALAQGTPTPTPTPSVLVTTAAPLQGSLPRTIAAYGTMQASPGNNETLSLLRAGQVTRVAVALGQLVRQGDTLMVVTADPAALTSYRQAVAALTLARGERARLAQMLAQQLATRDQLAVADKAVADAQSTLDLLTRGGGSTAEQTLTAPFDGVVTALPAMPGARFAAQSALVTLDRSNQLVASLGIEPGVRGLVHAGQPARIEPLDGGAPSQGSVRMIGAMLDPATRLVPALIDASDPAGAALLQGGAVRVVIEVGAFSGWLLPRGAVSMDAKGAFVFQVADGRAVRIDVQVAGTVAGTTVVTGVLDPARPLVVSGNAELQDKAAVREDKTAGIAAR